MSKQTHVCIDDALLYFSFICRCSVLSKNAPTKEIHEEHLMSNSS